MLEISTAISGVATTLQALKAAVAARDEVKINDAISELKDRLFDVQSANLQVVDQLHQAQTRIHALVEDLRKLEAQVDERRFYKLYNIAKHPDAQFWVYRYEIDASTDQALSGLAHYLCQPCFDQGKKSILGVGDRGARCSLCKTFHAFPESKVADRGVRSGNDW